LADRAKPDPIYKGAYIFRLFIGFSKNFGIGPNLVGHPTGHVQQE
jgi:hypothetical protein